VIHSLYIYIYIYIYKTSNYDIMKWVSEILIWKLFSDWAQMCIHTYIFNTVLMMEWKEEMWNFSMVNVAMRTKGHVNFSIIPQTRFAARILLLISFYSFNNNQPHIFFLDKKEHIHTFPNPLINHITFIY